MSEGSLVVAGPDGPRPFLLGYVVRSLVSRGVPFTVALETARKAHDRLEQRKRQVTPAEIRDLLRELLPEAFESAVGDLVPPGEPPRVISPQGSTTRFSKGILGVSLQGAGLEPGDAFEVAQALEADLLRSGAAVIERHELRERVTEMIERRHGAEVARHYRIARTAQDEARPIFVLLGGSTGAGKTSIAIEAARRLEISRVIGTDSIRQIMRLMFSQDLMPEIHCSTYDAHELLPPEYGSREERLIAGYREQAQKIAVGVQALLDRAIEENASLVIEGVNLIPGMLDLDRYQGRAHVIFLVVATLDRADYRAHFTSRARHARARGPERYLPHFGAILHIQDHILALAENFGVPIIDNVQLDETVLAVIRAVIEVLETSVAIQD